MSPRCPSKPSPPSSPRGAASARQLRPLAWTALAGAIALVWIAAPVGVGIVLGTLIAFTLLPIYERVVAHRSPRHRALVAALCAALATIVVGLVLAILGYLLVERGADLVQRLPGLTAPDGALTRVLHRGQRTFWDFGVDLAARLREAASYAAGRVAEAATAAARTTFDLLLAILFMALTSQFVLLHWPTLVRRAERLLPFERRNTRELLAQLRVVGRNVFLGTFVTALAQGALAGVGYVLFGVPQAAFFGAMTAVASLFPGLGTLFVWVPLGLWLLFSGHVGAGVGELVYGSLVVVAFPDYYLRPKLVGGQEMPLIATYVSLFGGLALFGFVGFLIGPVIAATALSAMSLYERERARIE